MRLLTLNLLRFAFDGITAISSNLSETFGLLTGVRPGGHNPVASTFVDVEGLTAIAALPIPVSFLGAAQSVRGKNVDRRDNLLLLALLCRIARLTYLCIVPSNSGIFLDFSYNSSV